MDIIIVIVVDIRTSLKETKEEKYDSKTINE